MAFYSVIPAGGFGTRLWPLSRPERPKFLLDLTGSGATLLQQTQARLSPVSDGIIVITGQAHRAQVISQLPEMDPSDVLTEPSGRDSMAAIGLAAAVLLERHPDEDVIIGSFAADHVIGDVDSFQAALGYAIEAARSDYIVTLGIRPRGPSTAFGYIHFADELIAGAPAHRVLSFVEKPDAIRAAEYLATGQYRWNAGMYVMRAQVLLDHLARLQPSLHAGLRAIAACWDTPERDEELARYWGGLTRISIDHAISEPLAPQGRVAMVEGDFDWDDVGDFDSLAQIASSAEGVSVVNNGGPLQVVNHRSDGALVVNATDGLAPIVAISEVPGIVIVNAGDVLLVTTREAAQQVKQISQLVTDQDTQGNAEHKR